MSPQASVQMPDDQEREAALWRAVREDGHEQARETLFNLYAPYARMLAHRAFRQRARGDLEKTDFEQLAYEALLEAMGRFDPGRNVPFRAFATARINGNIADGVAHMTEVRGQLSWRQRMRQDRMKSLARPPENMSAEQALDALAELALGLALGFMLEGTGLYVDEEADEPAVSTPAYTAYDSLAWKELVHLLNAEMLALDPRDRTILQFHYVQGMAFDHVASLLSLSKGRISQLHKAALTKLRKRMTARGHFRLER